jgi:hypothetical protein
VFVALLQAFSQSPAQVACTMLKLRQELIHVRDLQSHVADVLGKLVHPVGKLFVETQFLSAATVNAWNALLVESSDNTKDRSQRDLNEMGRRFEVVLDQLQKRTATAALKLPSETFHESAFRCRRATQSSFRGSLSEKRAVIR